MHVAEPARGNQQRSAPIIYENHPTPGASEHFAGHITSTHVPLRHFSEVVSHLPEPESFDSHDHQGLLVFGCALVASGFSFSGWYASSATASFCSLVASRNHFLVASQLSAAIA